MEVACFRCRAPIASGARFCANCGNPVDHPTTTDAARHAQLAATAPSTLMDKLRATSSSGQRKPVTALFADVVGSTGLLEVIDPEDWGEIMNRAFGTMSQAIYRYEGTVAQLIGDGLLAFFGAPVAHEDDPERAVRAALDMVHDLVPLRRELKEGRNLDYQIRVGINTGPVMVGTVGSDLRYQYTAIGDAINVAARIQAAARPGSVLVTQATHRFITPNFTALEVGELELKGKTVPVRAYEVIGIKERPEAARGLAGFESPLVGRQKNLDELVDLFEAEAAHGGIAAIVGEPGLGKSRLLTEVHAVASLSRPRMVWAEGHCLSYGRNLPYHLLLELVRSLIIGASGHEPEDDRALDRRLRGLLGSAATEHIGYLVHLLAVRVEGGISPEIESLEPQALHQRYLGALGALLRSIAGIGPIALVCEDVHWADSSSIDALIELLPLVRELPMLLLITARPDHDASGWRLIAAARARLEDALTEMTLTSLSDEDSRAMVSALLRVESLPHRVRSFILERAEGNPFFIEEVIRTLIDQGAIERRGDSWVATDSVQRVQIPVNLHGLLLARIDRLPQEAGNVLRVASVIGREFSQAILEAMSHEDGVHDNLSPALRTLEAAGLIRPIDEEREGEFVFHHVLIQDAAYDSLLKQDRRRLHSVVADIVARGPAREGAVNAGVIAMHLERAGRADEALPYLIDAGRHALERFANAEARDFFDRAASRLPERAEDPETVRLRVEVELGRVKAGYTFIPFGGALDALEEVLPEAEKVRDRRLLAEVHYWIALLRHMQGELPQFSPELKRSLDRALEIGTSLNDERLLARPLALMGLSKFVSSDLRAATQLLERAVSLLEYQGSLKEAAYFAGILGISYARLGDFTRVDQWLPRIGELAETAGDPNASLDADIHRGMIQTERGDLEEAMRLLSRGIELAEKVDNKICLVVAHFAMGDQQLRRGRPELAIPPLEKSTEIAQYCNASDVENLSRAWLSAAHSQLGNVENALPGFEASLAAARQMGDLLGEGEILRHRAVALSRNQKPDWSAVERDFEASIGIFEGIGARPYVARALRDFGFATKMAGRIEEGRQKLQRAAELLDEMGIRGHGKPSEEGIATAR